MRVLAFGVMTLVLTGVASALSAQDEGLASFGIKVVQPMSDKEIASTRSRVDATLAKSGAASLFDNVTDATGGKARHRASGLVCRLGKKGQQLVSASADAAECENDSDGAISRTSVSRAPDGATLDSIEVATRAAVEKEPDYAPAPGAQVVARPNPGSGIPEHRTLHFISKADGRDRATHLRVGLVRGWVLIERQENADTSEPPLGMIDLLQESMFGTSMKPAQ